MPSEQPREGTRVEVSNDQLVTVRDTMRGLNRMVAALDSGEAEKFVITKHGKMKAVLLPIGGGRDEA